MNVEAGRKVFIDNYIQLCICSLYRAGFDPTKEWLEDDVEEYELTLKESWVELDHDHKNRKTLNTESLPNEVRIFEKINENRNDFIDKCVPTMVVGGSVYIKFGFLPGSNHFSTVKKYCGALDIVDLGRDIQPSTQTTTEPSAGNDKPKFSVANRVQQRLLMLPTGHPLSALHTWAHKPQYISKFRKSNGSQLLVDYVLVIFSRLFCIIHDLYKNCQVYHRDLSEGNVLVRENNGDPYPLLIDFDHARLCSDTVNDSIHFGMGTVPFMSILNLAGYSHKLSDLDELESLLYLLVWKCTIGFTSSDITRGKTARNTPQVPPVQPIANPLVKLVTRLKLINRKSAALVQRSKHRVGQTKQLNIRSWAKGDPGDECLDAKYLHASSDGTFKLVLGELRPEFQVFKPLLSELRRILFDWDGKQ
ncbi:hypothetical protein IWQ62_004458, partial [Dispira parvispora]